MDLYNEHDYAMERRLRDLDPELHRRFTDSLFALQYILSNYKLIFPTFTDHTELHSLNVIDFCNRIIASQINKMNADEIYCLLMGSYFHDTGMGISSKDYEAFSKEIDFGDYFETHSSENIPDIIRDFHNEFSGLFLKKYASMFDIPSGEHLQTIIQISRGHRKTCLTDENVYPVSLSLPNGNTVCVPYLASLVRLADEVDVASGRNMSFLYDMDSITDERSLIEFGKHNAISEVIVTPESFDLMIISDDDHTLNNIKNMSIKMQKTLDDCRFAVNGRTPFVITQKSILLKRYK